MDTTSIWVFQFICKYCINVPEGMAKWINRKVIRKCVLNCFFVAFCIFFSVSFVCFFSVVFISFQLSCAVNADYLVALCFILAGYGGDYGKLKVLINVSFESVMCENRDDCNLRKYPAICSQIDTNTQTLRI